MTVKELIDFLAKQSPDADIWLNVSACFGDGGCCVTAEGPLNDLGVSGSGMVYLTAYQDKPIQSETASGRDPETVITHGEWKQSETVREAEVK